MPSYRLRTATMHAAARREEEAGNRTRPPLTMRAASGATWRLGWRVALA
jgi:hypothetical protein